MLLEEAPAGATKFYRRPSAWGSQPLPSILKKNAWSRCSACVSWLAQHGHKYDVINTHSSTRLGRSVDRGGLRYHIKHAAIVAHAACLSQVKLIIFDTLAFLRKATAHAYRDGRQKRFASLAAASALIRLHLRPALHRTRIESKPLTNR
jgi:hypothetical protein